MDAAPWHPSDAPTRPRAARTTAYVLSALAAGISWLVIRRALVATGRADETWALSLVSAIVFAVAFGLLSWVADRLARRRRARRR